jgi:hypothetical protein
MATVTITSEAAAEIAATRSAMYIGGKMLLGFLFILITCTSVSLILGFLHRFSPTFVPLL